MKVWITCDRDNTVCIFSSKPKKGLSVWTICEGGFMVLTNINLPEGINPQWSDDEPTEINLKLERVKK